MEFKFKRKYTKFFFAAIFLHVLVLCFWMFAPNNLFGVAKAKKIITLLALVNCELILIFFLGLYRKKFFVFHDKISIKRSLFSTITIDYKTITEIIENENDTIFLGTGHRPSFKILYKTKFGKIKKYTIRSDNNKLLLKVIKNEIEIAKINNTNNK